MIFFRVLPSFLPLVEFPHWPTVDQHCFIMTEDDRTGASFMTSTVGWSTKLRWLLSCLSPLFTLSFSWFEQERYGLLMWWWVKELWEVLNFWFSRGLVYMKIRNFFSHKFGFMKIRNFKFLSIQIFMWFWDNFSCEF